MTNAEKIKAMSNEELADFLKRIQDSEREDWTPIGCYNCAYYKTHHQPQDCFKEKCEFRYGVLGWLNSEA